MYRICEEKGGIEVVGRYRDCREVYCREDDCIEVVERKGGICM